MRALLRLAPGNDAPDDVETGGIRPRRPESGYPERADRQRADRVLGAIAAMAVAYARLGNLDAARRAADEALSAFGDATDGRAIAEASTDLGEALVVLGDPTCREILEDAGTLFEDLDDDDGVRRVDQLLRVAEATIEPSPRSFHPRRVR